MQLLSFLCHRGTRPLKFLPLGQATARLQMHLITTFALDSTSL